MKTLYLFYLPKAHCKPQESFKERCPHSKCLEIIIFSAKAKDHGVCFVVGSTKGSQPVEHIEAGSRV